MNVNEIFHSISGEGVTQGYPTTFVRLTGCNLDCAWCDTRYAKTEEGTEMHPPKVAEEILKYLPTKHVILTGGEPLMQRHKLGELFDILTPMDFFFTIETNGSLPVKDVLRDNVFMCMDVKCPSSNMHDKVCMENFSVLRSEDEVKYVVGDKDDWDYAIQFERYVRSRYNCKAQVSFSPAWSDVDGIESNREWFAELASLMLTQGPVNAKYSLQIHKVIWEPKARGV